MLHSLQRCLEGTKIHRISLLAESLTHDANLAFRSPLQTIRSTLELVQLHQDKADADQSFRRALRAVATLSRHFENQLMLAQSEAGTFILRPQRIDVAQTLRVLVREMHDAAASRDIRLALEQPTAGVVVVTDGVRLRQLMENLVMEALRRSGSGGEVVLRLPTFRGHPSTFRLEVLRRSAEAQDVTARSAIEYVPDAGDSTQLPAHSALGLAATRALIAHLGATTSESFHGNESTLLVEMPGTAAGHLR